MYFHVTVEHVFSWFCATSEFLHFYLVHRFIYFSLERGKFFRRKWIRTSLIFICYRYPQVFFCVCFPLRPFWGGWIVNLFPPPPHTLKLSLPLPTSICLFILFVRLLASFFYPVKPNFKFIVLNFTWFCCSHQRNKKVQRSDDVFTLKHVIQKRREYNLDTHTTTLRRPWKKTTHIRQNS